MRKAILLFSIVCFTSFLSAQELPTFTIQGFVKDSKNLDPLPNVNVFLANTSRGAATNLKGEFIIKNVPAGVYDIVVSMVGYERFVTRLRLFDYQKKPLQVHLKETTYEVPQIEVVAKDNAEWRKQLAKFKKYIFGETSNGAQCELKNPLDLDFHTDPKTDRFEATARRPLTIENRALGYKLEFVLQVFIIDGLTFKYGGLTHFMEMTPKDSVQRKEWNEARERAYRGSMRHFFVSLIKNRLEQEGFNISLMYQIPNSRTRLVPREEVTRDEILKAGHYPFERRLIFQSYLRVEYTREEPEPGFMKFWADQSRYQDPMGDQYQVSWLTLTYGDVRMGVDGNLYDPYNLLTYGYWSYERIGEWLPLDYQSSEK